MKIVVTGGAGFIGFHLTDLLLKQGHNVTVFDNFSGSRPERVSELKDAEIIEGSVSNAKELYEASRKAGAIYHLAAQTSVPNSMQDPRDDLETNLKGTVNVLETARRTGAKVVFTSTAAVYGQPIYNPIPETHPLNPISFYGLAKRAAEDYCKLYHENFNIECVIVRIFNCYGPHCHGVVHDIIRKLQVSTEELILLGAPNWAKDFIYVSDVVRALHKILDLESSSELKIFNLGSGHAARLDELAEEICKQVRCKPEFRFTGESWPGDITKLHADTGKIREDLHWQPMMPLTDGISDTVRRVHLDAPPLLEHQIVV
jgi:UDP-glucose 4-epimerase